MVNLSGHFRRSSNDAEPSVGELAGQIVQQVRALVRSELQLAAHEAKQRARGVRGGAVYLTLALVLGVFGAMCALAAALIALTDAIGRPWFVAFIGMAALLFGALLVVLPGWRGVMEGRPTLMSVRENVQADIAVLRKAIHR